MNYFIPLLGVVLGWFLKELSSTFVNISTYKQKISYAVTLLLYLNQEMILIEKQIKAYEVMAVDKPELEKLRYKALNEFTNKDENFDKSINRMLDSLAESHPVESVRIRKIIDDYKFYKRFNLTHSANVEAVYEKLAFYKEKAFAQYRSELEKMVKKLAFVVSIPTGIKVRKEYKLLNDKDSTRRLLNIEGLIEEVDKLISSIAIDK